MEKQTTTKAAETSKKNTAKPSPRFELSKRPVPRCGLSGSRFGGMLITVAGRGGQVSFAGVGVDVYTIWMAAGAVMAGFAARLAR